MTRFVLTAFILITALSAARADEPAHDEPFASEIHVFDVEDQVYPPSECGTLFIGSSSIRFWFKLGSEFQGRNIIRRGFGGSTISDVNYYFDRLVSRYKPREIVFYAGENDINSGLSPDRVFSDFREFMEKKSDALGDVPVYFISIKPSIARAVDYARQSRANAMIEAYSNERSDVIYVDVASRMMENGRPKPLFIGDNLHMSADGYEIWRMALADAFRHEEKRSVESCD